MNKSLFTINQRQISYDIIRFVAILTVFSIHCMAGLDAQRNTDTNIFVSNLFHAFQSIGVPLFVLLSGALLLGRLDSPVDFLKKRITRVLVPFVMWSILLYGIYYFVDPTYYGFDLRITPPYEVIMKFIDILCFNGIHGVYWYVYMILGLYFVAPILQRFLQNANEHMVLYACMMVSTVVVMNTLIPDFLVTKRMVSSNLIFLGYFLSGYYVKQHLLQKSWSKPILKTSAILLLVLSFINQYYPVVNQGIVVYFMSISFFGALMKCNIENRIVAKYVTFVSRTSYGMYLSHVLLISMFIKIGIEKLIPIALVPFMLVTLILVIESVMMYTINKLKLSKYLGG